MSVLAMLAPPALRAHVTGRSYWQLKYIDGRVISEGEVDWSLAPYRGRQGLRLYCPDGKVAELGNTTSAEGRLFQLKVGIRRAGAGKATLAHIIGMLVGTDGQASCYAWEPDPGRLVGPFADNVFAMRYQQIGLLSADVLGIKPV